MAFIEEASSDDAAAEMLFDADRERLGYVANYTRVFAHRPAVYGAWRQLAGAITEHMDHRRYELATLAAAQTLRSSYCTLAHGGVLAKSFYDPGTVLDIVRDRQAAGLDDTDLAIMGFAEKVARDATSITQADVDRLRELGLSDVEVLDVALTAAARCFFSKTLDALGIRPDSALAELEPDLRDALTVGRPIAET